jgi:tetratricopeptide (TPR) repeat protein
MEKTIESLLRQGYQARREHRLADAKAFYTESVSMCAMANNQPDLAESLTRLGGIERDLGEIDPSLLHYQQAVAIFRKVDNPLRLAHTVRHVGDILRESSQNSLALPCYEEALAIYRSHPETNTLDLANTLRGYALLQTDLGKRQEAIELWKDAGAVYNHVWQEPGSPYSEADLTPGIEESKRQIALLSAR